MKRKITLMIMAVIVTLSSCMKQDLDDIRDRLSNLESWQATVNSSITSLQGLVQALENKDFVTSVTPLIDGTGYIINFTKSSPITIKHGTKGDKGETPIISTKVDIDGKYYWTVSGEWLKDAEDNKIRTTGNNGDAGITPHIDTNGNWWIGTTDTGVKAQGNNGDAGITPHINANGNWWIGTIDTGVKAEGNNGDAGITPHINANGNWWIGTTDTGVKAQGNNGDAGITPHINANGNWWIGNTDTGVKAEGNDAIAVQVRINSTSGEWEVSINSGVSWTSTGVKAQGDALFVKDGIDTTNPDNITFTLADGNKITLPRTNALTISFDSYEPFIYTSINNEIVLQLSPTKKRTDYSAIMAKIESNNGTGTDIKTRASSTPWKVVVSEPTFTDDVLNAGSAKVTLMAPSLADNGETALLKVTIVDNKGNEVSTSRVIKYFGGIIVRNTAGNLNSQGILATTTALMIEGSLNAADFTYIRTTLTFIETLDLAETDLTEIPAKALAFYSNPNTTLKSITLPQTVTTIGNSAFAECEALESFEFPEDVTTLGRWMFEGCTKLETLTIPSKVVELPASAFYGASGLESITIPMSVTTIGNWAFQGCTSLQSVIVPESVTTLGDGAFMKCGNLKNVTLSSSITDLKIATFQDCENIEDIQLPIALITIGDRVFSGCKKLANITLPETVESLGNELTFFGCKALTEIIIPSKVTAIPMGFVGGCINLGTIIMKGQITKIGDSAFHDTAITTIEFPSSITLLGSGILSDCPNLTSIKCKATTVPDIITDRTPYTFDNMSSGVVLLVPAASVSAYHASWNTYFPSGIQAE